MTEDQLANDQDVASTEVDRYPEFREGLRRILDEAEPPEGTVERLEVTFLANGEATYRMYLRGFDEPEGGVLPPA